MTTVRERAKKPKVPRKQERALTGDIVLLSAKQSHWTEEEYLALEQNAGNRMIELVNGCLEFLPMPNMLHQDILDFLYSALKVFAKEHELGRVYFAPLPVRLWPGQFREPDIAFFKTHRIKDKRKPPDGADLVMEIVSPGAESRGRDLEDKRADYAKAKIPEYWIVDPEKRSITVLTLSGKSYKVHGVFKEGTHATSKLLKGFKIAVSEVFAAGDV